MLVGAWNLVLETDRLLSELVEAKRFVTSAGMASKSACGQPWRPDKRTAIGAWPINWGAQLAVSVSQSGRGLRTWVQEAEESQRGLKSRGQR